MKTNLLFTFSLLALIGWTAQAFAGDAAAGKAKYDMLCASCHGTAGAGDGPAAAALNPKPRNLQITARTDDEMKKIIREGGASAGLSATMPALGAMLSPVDLDNIVAHVRTLKK